MSKTREDWAEIWNDSIEELKPKDLTTEEYLSGVGSITRGPRPPSDFYNSEEIRKLGIKCGDNCLLHKTTNIVAPDKLELGNNVRIDGFSLISCGIGITIGSYVHVASHVLLMGGAGIEVGDYASIASGAKVFSVSDDVMGKGLVGPTVPMNKRHLHTGKVVLGEHSVLSINSVVMPRSELSKGSTLLPFSILVGAPSEMPYCVFSGVPAKYLKPKNDKLQKLVKEIEDEEK